MKQNQKKIIKRGDCLLTEEPFVYVLQSKYRKERCDNCLRSAKVLKCSNCNYVCYCNRSCQLESWPLHKIECPILKKAQPHVIPDAARMLCRLIIKLENGGDMIRGYYTEKCSRKFRDLMSHYNEIKNDFKRQEHLETLHAILNEIMQGSAVVVPNQSELMSIYGRLITNGFNILDPDMNSIATAIYLGISIIDHSCKPNAVATFEGKTLHVQAIEDIEELDWSKINISYIELLNPPAERRAELKTNYYFYCVCPKCTDQVENFQMNAACCPNKNCSEYVDVNLNNCTRCATVISEKHRSNFNEAIVFTKDNLERMKEVAYLDVCKICLSKQAGYLHKFNLWYVKTLDAAFESAIAVEKWSEALEYGQKLVPGFRKYYGDWNPLLGLLYLKIGKIQLYENFSKEALHNFQEARKILIITHGATHSIIREQLLPMLMQATAKQTS